MKTTPQNDDFDGSIIMTEVVDIDANSINNKHEISKMNKQSTNNKFIDEVK